MLENYQTHQTLCPYLVGSYKTVAVELTRYIELGFQTFILDIPPDEEELQHTALAFEQATRRTRGKESAASASA